MDRVKYEVKYQDFSKKEYREWLKDGGCPKIKTRLRINPPLSPILVQKIKTIEGVGFINEGVDYVVPHLVSSDEILLEINCTCVGLCQEYSRRLISNILKVLIKEGCEVSFS